MGKFKTIAKNTFLNVWGIFDFFIIFWVIIYFLQRMITKINYTVFGKYWVYATGLIGTPIHEFSHAFVAILFGHKIQKIEWFRPQSDGTLGYVIHTYNPSSFYQSAGNFFIGIAPLIFGSLFLFLLMQLLLPNRDEMNSYIKTNKDDRFSFIQESIYIIFNHYNFKKKSHYVFLLLSASIANHLVPSIPDMKGALSGFTLIFIIIVILTLIMNVLKIDKKTSDFELVKQIKKYLILLFTFSTIILLINFVFSYLICGTIYFIKYHRILLPL